jgi:hypothetical protein
LVGLIGGVISPAARPLPTQDNTYIEETHTSMRRVGFEPTIQVLEWAKKFHALDRAATVIDLIYYYRRNIVCFRVVRYLFFLISFTSLNWRNGMRGVYLDIFLASEPVSLLPCLQEPATLPLSWAGWILSATSHRIYLRALLTAPNATAPHLSGPPAQDAGSLSTAWLRRLTSRGFSVRSKCKPSSFWRVNKTPKIVSTEIDTTGGRMRRWLGWNKMYFCRK